MPNPWSWMVRSAQSPAAPKFGGVTGPTAHGLDESISSSASKSEATRLADEAHSASLA